MEKIVETKSEEKRSEQLASKIAPTVRKQLDDTLITLGFKPGDDGHVKWDQEKLLALIEKVRTNVLFENHKKYGEIVVTINQYSKLINTQLMNLISSLDTDEARIRSEYEKKIEYKDGLITDLQKSRDVLDRDRQTAIEDAEKAKEELLIAEKRRDDALALASDKEKIIQLKDLSLADQGEKLIELSTTRETLERLEKANEELKGALGSVTHEKELIEVKLASATEEVQQSKSVIEQLQQQNANAEDKITDLQSNLQSLQRDLEEQKRHAEQVLSEQAKIGEQTRLMAVEQAVTKTREELQEQIVTLRVEKERAIAQAKEELFEQINSLREDKARLEMQIELLQSQLEHKKV